MQNLQKISEIRFRCLYFDNSRCQARLKTRTAYITRALAITGLLPDYAFISIRYILLAMPQDYLSNIAFYHINK